MPLLGGLVVAAVMPKMRLRVSKPPAEPSDADVSLLIIFDPYLTTAF
jgi:hypothetical protein